MMTPHTADKHLPVIGQLGEDRYSEDALSLLGGDETSLALRACFCLAPKGRFSNRVSRILCLVRFVN